MKAILLTEHARKESLKRGIRLDWIEAALTEPDWREADPEPPKWRLYRRISERDGRVLRVVVVEDGSEVRVITAFFDRDAKRPS